MRRRFMFPFFSVLLFGFSSLFLSRHFVSDQHGADSLSDDAFRFFASSTSTRNSAIQERDGVLHKRRVSSVSDDLSEAVLIPSWEVLVIASPHFTSDDRFFCLFQNNFTSPARFSGVVPSTNRSTFKCLLPERLRRIQPFLQPLLTRTPDREVFDEASATGLLRWKFLAYDSLSTEDDVVLFVKGPNHRSGINRSPTEFNCVFGKDSDAVRTAVTSSVQEVFRCPHPNLTASSFSEPIRVSIEIKQLNHRNLVVPSVAYYTPPRSIDNDQPKSLLCASTMVYNVAKFLKEWVMYHSSIGIQRFILYDNDSEDNLRQAVADLNHDGYSVAIVHWIWPKTQEAGFSHSAIYARSSCEWMLYIDVDEFVYAPSWANAPDPSPTMLHSLLSTRPGEVGRVGQVSIKCNEFGPSGRVAHPEEGVTQGYDCRRRREQRHKSVVRLTAVDRSLLNVIHHFRVGEGYRTRVVGMGTAVVNHYKYQAWEEFRSKFRRRVSAYVADWTDTANPESKDRTPGLGFTEVEPEGWSDKFCDLRDDRLKELCRRWFGDSGYKMAWQRQ